MKTFITGMAMIILMVSCLCFTTDLNSYVLAQGRLKTLAEECADAGALSCSYNKKRKRPVIDTAAARAAVNSLLELYPDVRLASEPEVENGENRSSVTVELVYEHQFFRMPFLRRNEIRRKACYAWEF